MLAKTTPIIAEIIITTCPAALYLASLSAGESRRSTLGVLHRAVKFWDPQANIIGYPWAKLSYTDVQALRSHVATLAPNTGNRVLSAVRRVLRHAWRMGAINQEQWQALCDIEPIRGERLPPGRALSMAELGRLLSTARANDRKWRGVRNQAIIALLYAAGLRRAELAGLMAADVQTPVPNRLRVRVKGKGNKERLIPLPAWANPILAEWLAIRGDAPGFLFVKRNEGPQPWPGMGPEAVREIILRTVKRAEIAHVAPHDFRRTYISSLLDTSKDVSAVQKLAGHANVKTTLRYDRRNERAAEAAADHLPAPLAEASQLIA